MKKKREEERALWAIPMRWNKRKRVCPSISSGEEEEKKSRKRQTDEVKKKERRKEKKRKPSIYQQLLQFCSVSPAVCLFA